MSALQRLNIDEVAIILRDKVSPLLRSHGGDLALSKVSGNEVYVRFAGACRFCPSAYETVEKIVRSLLRDHFGDNDIEVILDNSVSDDLIAQAKKILHKS